MGGGLVTLGEAMGVFGAQQTGPLRQVPDYRLSFAGAESNVAIGVRRLGHPSTWIGRVGDDELGLLVTDGLRGEGVDVSLVRRDPEAPTGIMIKERRTGDVVRVHYHRRGSAGSRLGPSDIPEEVVRTAGLLHVTGITPLLSRTAAEAVRHAVTAAASAGVPVSLDVNHRQALGSVAHLRDVLVPLLPHVDLIFAGEDELLALTGADSETAALRSTGNTEVVVKRGAHGASLFTNGKLIHREAVPVRAVDAVGAGDAFAAGYIAGLLDGLEAAERLDMACATGAFAVTVSGDWHGLPRRDELGLLAVEAGTVVR